MNTLLFWQLVLAHLIADFPLQTDVVFRIRAQYRWGVVLHAGIFAAALGWLVFPYFVHPAMVAYALLLFAAHILIDKLKLSLVIQTEEDTLGRFLQDQLMHIGLVAIVAVLARNQIPVRIPPLIAATWFRQRFVILACCTIAGTYTSTILIYYLRKSFAGWLYRRRGETPTYWKKEKARSYLDSRQADRRQPAFPRALLRNIGMLERALQITFILLGLRLHPAFLLLLPLPLAARLAMRRREIAMKGRSEIEIPEILLSCALAVLFGLLGSLA